MVKRILGWLFLGLAMLSAFDVAARADDPPPFVWKDGDRVVLVGDALIERDQKYGYLETIITARNPEKSITFRNLGWSGDTVRGLSRARFGPPAEGWQHLIDHVKALHPTVLIVGYGMADSFDGAAGLPAFVSGLNAFLDAVNGSKPRLMFLSPIAHEDLGRPLPDPSRHNLELARYRDAVKTLAGERHGWFFDLFDSTLSTRDYGIAPLTENGIHLSPFGSWYLATLITRDARRRREQEWNARVTITENGFRTQGILSKTKDSSAATRDHVRFDDTLTQLPPPPAPLGAPKDVVWGDRRSLRITGLDPGSYRLTIDSKEAATARHDVWAKGVSIVQGPDFEQLDALRRAVNEKNDLYFYRWRPQNETYLFGFRKHEQGNNAREIPLFDPLVEAKEKEIARLKQPVPHVFELSRVKE